MKILLCSYVFSPSVGGVESVGKLLVEEFRAAGHEVRVVTNSPGEPSPAILRRPTPSELIRNVRWADVVFHNSISLRFAWPLAFLHKPLLIAHHTWLRRPDGTKGIAERLKAVALRRGRNIAVSSAVARALPVKTRVIANPYDAGTFHVRKNARRNRSFIFAGRLVSDKGVDLLLEAMRRVHAEGLTCDLTIVGDGPERRALEAMATNFGLNNHVRFVGMRAGPALSALLNEHRVLVVPSRWAEPFGLVALEAIACGCAVIGTSGGGLPAAIGPCGVTVPNGDAGALTLEMSRVLRAPELVSGFLAKAEAHLKQHHPATVAQQYLELLEEMR